MPINVLPEDLETVKTILQCYVPQEEVWVFGSRVTGKSRPFSDLDLAIITQKPLSLSVFMNLQNAFSESDLPFKVDVIDWAATKAEFQKIIQAQHEVLIYI